MCSATVSQPAINIREKINELDTHHHDCDYVKHGEVFGKNLLINADKSVSQRGTWVAEPSGAAAYYIDRFYLTGSAVIVNITHGAYDHGIAYVGLPLDRLRPKTDGKGAAYTAEEQRCGDDGGFSEGSHRCPRCGG